MHLHCFLIRVRLRFAVARFIMLNLVPSRGILLYFLTLKINVPMIKEFCFATPPHFGCQISFRGLFLARFLLLLLFAFPAEAIVAQVGDYPGYEDPGDGEPTAEVTIECDRVCVKFTGSISALDNNWDFGDGTTGRGPSVTHCYKDANFYTMKWKYRVSPFDQWTEHEFPLKAIFAGEGCGSVRQISNLVPKVLPAGQLDNSTVYIFGNLEVDVPYQFNGCNIKVLPGEVLRVASGGTLSVTGGLFEPHLLPGCPQLLWNGFEVRENSSLTLNGPTIKAALYGVQPVNLTSSQTLPNLTLTGATFLENFIGFYVKTGKFSLSKFNGNIFTGSTFPYGYRFCGGGSLPTDIPFLYQTYAGVVVEGGMGARFIMPVSAAGNKFSNLPAGVVIKDADALIRGCEFTNILLSYLGNSMPLEKHGSAIIANMSAPARLLTVRSAKVTTADRGIYAKVTGMNSQVNIYNTDMDGIQNGIDVECSGANLSGEISNNQITCNRYNTLLNALRHNLTVTGISVKYPTMASGTLAIGNNEVNVHIPAFFGPPAMLQIEPKGIHVNSVMPVTNTAAFNFAVYGNQIALTAAVEGVRIGNVVNGTLEDNQITFLAPSQNLSFGLYAFRVIGGSDHSLRCNTITSSGVLPAIALYSQGSARIKVDGNKTLLVNGVTFQGYHGTSSYVGGNQLEYLADDEETSHGIYYNNAITGPQYLTGNQWVGDFFHGAYFSGGESSYCPSLYTVSHAANVGPGTSNPVVATMDACGPWFTVIQGAMESAALAGCGAGGSSTVGEAAGANAADMMLLSGGLAGLEEGHAWAAESDIYQKFSEHPEWTSGQPLIQTFMQSRVEQSVGQISGLRKGLVGISHTDPVLLPTLEELRTEKSALLEILSEKEAAAETDPVIAAGLPALEADWHAIEILGAPLYARWDSIVVAMASNLKTQNTEVACTAQPCLNEKWLYDLYIDVQLLKNRSPNVADLNNLRTLAITCPEVGGPAVYMAQGFYQLLTGEWVEGPCGSPFPPNEEAEERGQTLSVQNAENLRVSPNPANELVNLVLPPFEGTATLILSDALGNFLQRITLPEGQRFWAFNTKAYASGLYLLHIEANGRRVSRTKLVVAH